MSPYDRHVVRFFRDDSDFIEECCDFVSTGLELRDGCVLAVESRLCDRILHELAARGYARELDRLDWHAAERLADELSTPGGVDAARFHATVGAAVVLAARQAPGGRARVVGTIVNVLWLRGKHAQAAALEKAWVELGKRAKFSLLCAYHASSLSCDCDLLELADSHDAVLPAREMRALDARIEAAVDSALGPDAGLVRSLIAAERRLAGLTFGEASLLWLRRHMPLVAAKIAAALTTAPA